jgi:hypothetical protein
MKFRAIFGWSVVSFFIVVFAVSLYKSYRLKNSFRLTEATILTVGVPMQKNGSWSLSYFFIDSSGDTIAAKTHCFLRISLMDSLIGRTVPCAYYKDNPNISQLLIYEHIWKQYGLTYPDSMKWTKRFFKDIIYSY